MQVNIGKAFLSERFLKIASLLIGYLLWVALSDSHVSARWIEVPISFYDKPSHMLIEAPETVHVELKGRRSALYNLEKSQLAIHINAQELAEGPQSCIINQQTMLLPSFITVNNYKPGNIILNVKKIHE
jgi:YbbR domain-containing protein